MTTTRRTFVGRGLAAGGLAAASTFAAPFIRTARAGQSTNSVVFASGEPLTGNWDPTSHTILGQINFEGYVFGRLTKTPMRPENPSEIQYELATGHKVVSEHILEWGLRKGVTFHNGAPFTAADVKATFEYASQPGKSAWYPGPVDVEIVDDYTVRLHTEAHGYPATAYILLASFLPIMSAADIAGGAISQTPNGTGPFKFVEQRGDETVMTAFDGFYEGRPKLNEFRFAYMGDANTRVLALLGGEADIIERLEPEQHDTLVGKDGIQVRRTVSTENKYLHFRCNKAPFDDVRMRRAVCHAIDRELVTEILGAAGHASSSYVSPVKLGGADIANYPKYDPEECQRLMAEAGYPGGNGLPELEYITSTGFYPKTKEYGELITALLQEQGLNVKLTVLETAAWLERIYQPESGEAPGHLVDVGWATGSPEPDLVLRPMWHSKQSLITGFKDEEVDAALDAEQAEGDPAKRLALIQEGLMPKLADKVPSLSLFTSVLIHGVRGNLDGAYFYPNGPIDLSKASYV
ncbi:MAG: ABC transporter substrate-binding protein [Geminicoccaceae bacterium]